jgi:hypothetical protein
VKRPEAHRHTPAVRRSPGRRCIGPYNSRFHCHIAQTPMEAERLNQLESLIDDLRRRVDELRGYL